MAQPIVNSKVVKAETTNPPSQEDYLKLMKELETMKKLNHSYK